MSAYYNEFDPDAAQWLRNLIAAGHLPPGDVDVRSITEVTPNDLQGYTQCHFFAGIGGWPLALRMAGWDDARPVWTGSCPCQPFSVAGQGNGVSDPRHLWPVWFDLLRECQPPVVFGEQVEAAIRHGWLDLVQADLEGSGYRFGAAVLPAAGLGAPHIRHRLFFVADAGRDSGESERHDVGGAPGCGSGAPWEQRLRADDRAGRAASRLADYAGPGWGAQPERSTVTDRRTAEEPGRLRAPGRLADSSSPGLEGSDAREVGRQCTPIERAGEAGALAHHDKPGRAVKRIGGVLDGERSPQRDDTDRCRETHSGWSDVDWLYCRDGKWRPVEPGLEPLAHGVSNRVGRLRAYGNAIVPQVAAAFIEAYMSCRP